MRSSTVSSVPRWVAQFKATRYLSRNLSTSSRVSPSPTYCRGFGQWTSRPSIQNVHGSRSPLWESVRHESGGSTFFSRLNALRKTNPIAVPAAVLSMIAACATLLGVSYIYITYFVPIDTTYPEPVAKKLKRALYYTTQDVQPQKAWDYYKQALAAAEEAGMHPFSNEVLGIKITAAGMLERTNHFREAIQVLDVLRIDCLRFVNWCEGQEEEVIEHQEGTEGKGRIGGTARDIKRARTRVLGKTVGICVKLGELNSNTYVNDMTAAEQAITQGVELALKERQRRMDGQVSVEEEGEWLRTEELGATLESLADHYESRSHHSLASPLYLRAITLAQPPSCHTAVLMNNLAISLAQTLPERALPIRIDPHDSSVPPPTSRTALITNARSWTEKALEICSSQRQPTRTDECDTACAVATHNLGEFAEMEGLVDEARRRYEEAKALARATGFDEGIRNADEGIKRLTAK